MKVLLNKILMPLIVIAFGVILIVISVNDLKKAKVYTETTAVITRIERTHHGDETHHTVFVKYTVNDNEYNQELGYYQAGFTEGKEIKVLYNPENPAEVMQAAKTIYIIMLIFAPILIAVGVSMFFRRR